MLCLIPTNYKLQTKFMASLEEVRSERLKKLALLKERGVNPYPILSSPDFTITQAINNFSKLSKKKGGITLAGRVMAIRGQGALVFFNIFDGPGTFQGLLKKNEVSEESFTLFSDTIDVGDFIEVKGTLFITKRKEKTISVKSWKMLAKSLRPLPDKWHGLEDVEERFRRRYLDTLMSEEVRNRFILRSFLITAIREHLNENGYLEVETPILQPRAGGALAEPFKTHHNALDIDLYLRIAPELYLKQLLVGGFPKVYELSRNFRNEGIDVTHNPEFTMLEYYEAYGNSEKMMAFAERMLKIVVKKILKTNHLNCDGVKIDFSKKFMVVSFFDLLKRYALISHPEKTNLAELKLKAQQLAVPTKPSDTVEKIMDNIYKKMCRPKIIQPTFIIDFPASFSPFAKKSETNVNFIDRFQLVVGGLEIANGFSELNDPADQRERYELQEKKRAGGEKEVSPSDEEYIEAMEYGMPPAGGIGIGIDRLVMLLTDTKNIREVILFPTMRPKG